jgi:glutamate formiminotransferase
VIECVINVSEGRDDHLIDRLARAGAPYVLDVHRDRDHNRSVLTLCGPGTVEERRGAVEEAAEAVAEAVVALVDLRSHEGAHPRIGALDVVPFVSLVRGPAGLLEDGPMGPALEARDRFATWAASSLRLPCFLYGPERSLPEVRRGAWTGIGPDRGPASPHPTAGAAAVGARPVLVAYNLWLGGEADLALARTVAGRIRGGDVRALGLALGDRVQVSCNLIRPWLSGPGVAFDAVARALEGLTGPGAARVGIERAELVGLLPAGVLARDPVGRWTELGIHPADTIEARLETAGLDGGRF